MHSDDLYMTCSLDAFTNMRETIHNLLTKMLMSCRFKHRPPFINSSTDKNPAPYILTSSSPPCLVPVWPIWFPSSTSSSGPAYPVLGSLRLKCILVGSLKPTSHFLTWEFYWIHLQIKVRWNSWLRDLFGQTAVTFIYLKQLGLKQRKWPWAPYIKGE